MSALGSGRRPTGRRFAAVAGTLLSLVVAACATPERAAPPRDVVWHQADEEFPSSEVFGSLGTRAAFNDARLDEAGAGAAMRDGDEERARSAFAGAARRYRDFVAKHPGTGWDLKIRYHAARLLSLAKRGAEAAAVARELASDPHASPKSKAMALLLATNALVDAGELEPIRMVFSREREGRPPQPRPLPAPWRSFVDATDALLAGLDPARPEPPGRIVSAAQLAVVAAQAEFAADHLPQARTRLEEILRRWPGDPAVVEGAARPYVETYLVAGDATGARTAAARVRELAEAQARSAAAGPEREKYQAVAREAGELEVGLRFDAAKALLDGHPAEAAAEFEGLADAPGADAAAALNGAAIAWDRAGEADRAAALRKRIVEGHAGSWVAPDAAIQLAAHLAKKGDHLGAGGTYRDHARRWPDDANHCVALRNGAVELDLAGHGEESAELYLAFGSDPRCADKSPNAAALALHLAGKQFLDARRSEDARDAFRRSASVKGVTDAGVKRRVAESSRILRRLERAAARDGKER